MTSTRSTRPRDSTSGHPSRRAAGLVAACALVGALLVALLFPGPRLGEARSGDPALVADTAAIVGQGRGISALSVARVENGTTTFAGFGDAGEAPPTPDTPFELGSITKTFTGHLLAIAVERGEMALDDPLARHLPELEGTPAGAATLQQLATHTSGLPRLPSEGASVLAPFSTDDPYDGWTTERVIDAARRVQVSEAGTREYSNLGMSLLGHAEAEAAGADTWTDLVTARLLQPLGMTATTFTADGGAEPEGLATPRTSNGRAVEPWSADGYIPSGSSTRTTARDLATYAAAVLRGTAPGASALQPVTDGQDRRSGLAWVIDESSAGPLTWHNGGTRGGSTILALDVANDRAALALATTSRQVDGIGVGLVRHDPAPLPREFDGLQLIALGVGVIGLVSLLWRVLRRPTRISLLTGALEAVAGLVLAWTLGPWGLLPTWVLGALAGAVVGAMALAGVVARTAPTTPTKNAGAAVFSLVVSAALVALLLVVVF